MREADSKPNIILVLTDHLRDDVLATSMPNVMRLAREGARFSNAYTPSPLCRPARLSIITGLYPSQHGACGNMSSPIASSLRDDTFMHHLRAAGYYTALIGKHHYIDRYGMGIDSVEMDDDEIKLYGFDHVWQVLGEVFGPGDSRHNDCRYTRHLYDKGILGAYRAAYQENAWACKAFPFEEDDYDDAYIGRKGCEFIRTYDGDKPLISSAQHSKISLMRVHPHL